MRKAHAWALAAGVFCSGFAASAQEIGVLMSARDTMTGSAPGEAARPLQVGAGMVAEERVVSDAAGGGQILFNDQTSLTIAPNSDVTLDAFVYDPNRDAGDMALSLTRGAVRFIGGRITKSREAIVTTPTASLAIRGGAALIDLSGGVLTVTHAAGERTEIRLPNGETLSLSQEGATAEVRPTSDGGFEIVYLGVATPQQIAERYASIQGAGQTTAFELDGVGETGFGFYEPGGVFRAPVSTSGAEPQESGALEPLVIIEQFENTGGEALKEETLPPPTPTADLPVIEEEEEEEVFE